MSGTMFSVAMMGATGAVGSRVAGALAGAPNLQRLTTLGRRPVPQLSGEAIHQHTIDVFDPSTYEDLLPGHQTAICTLGVGQPSKIDKAQFVRIDKTTVLDFATACRAAGVSHFQLLSSVGVSPNASSFYLRTKGELEDGLKALAFERLSLFHPSMILTPTNRYGLAQGLTLMAWPLLNLVMAGPMRRFRGIEVDRLGRAIAANARQEGSGVEVLEWDDFVRLAALPT